MILKLIKYHKPYIMVDGLIEKAKVAPKCILDIKYQLLCRIKHGSGQVTIYMYKRLVLCFVHQPRLDLLYTSISIDKCMFWAARSCNCSIFLFSLLLVGFRNIITAFKKEKKRYIYL